jgi:hypothetical protein
MHALHVLIYNTPTYFEPQWPIIRECSCTKQSPGHTTIFNKGKCGKIINVCYIEANLYTIIGATYRVEGWSVFTEFYSTAVVNESNWREKPSETLVTEDKYLLQF